MNNPDWSDIAAEAADRDPRQHPYGYLTGGSFVLDSPRVFVWFKSIDDLLKYMRDVVPRTYDLAPGEGLDDYQAAINPLLARVKAEGMSEPLRKVLGNAVSDHFVIDWWGTYPELREGRSEFGRSVLDGFLDEESEGQPLAPEDEDDFVEYLKTCYV